MAIAVSGRSDRAWVTFSGEIWGFPLGTLLDRLIARDYPTPFAYEPHGELQEHTPENGHAAAAVALVAAIIESHVPLAVLSRDGPDSADRPDVAELLRGLLQPDPGVEKFPKLTDEVAVALPSPSCCAPRPRVVDRAGTLEDASSDGTTNTCGRRSNCRAWETGERRRRPYASFRLESDPDLGRCGRCPSGSCARSSGSRAARSLRVSVGAGHCSP
jgi:hypothetical protein